MKFNIILLIGLGLGLSAIPTFAQSIQKKSIKESFSVNSNTCLAIINKHGKIHINTAPLSKIEVAVEVIAEGKTSDKAKAILKAVKVNISRGDQIKLETTYNSIWGDYANDIKIQTIRGGSKNKVKSKTKSKYQVNYTVKMPPNVDLEIVNRFGGVYLAEHKANLDLQLDYGNLKAQKLSGPDAKQINLKFGSADIDFVENAEVDVAYSNLTINKAIKVQYEGKHGEYRFGEVQDISGNSTFSDFSIEKLSGSLNMKSNKDGEFKVVDVSKSFTKLILDAQFSTIKVGFEESANYAFKINVKYGNLDYPKSTFKITESKEQNFTYFFKGIKGAQNGGQVDINSSYGDISLK